MLHNLKEHTKERVYLAIVLAIGLLRLINLGFLDLQAWDEALYAVRAEGIIRFGGWIDQTPFAIDGLYSALHPPLHVWLTALVFKIAGISEFSARFISTLAGFLSLVLLYRIGKKIATHEVGLLAVILFGLNPFVSFYARQGQFDTLLVLCLIAAVYWLIQAKGDKQWQFAILAGFAVGAALLTKLYIGLGIPATYAGFILFSRLDDKNLHWKRLAVVTVVAFLLAAPWHIYMTIAHGNGNPLFFLMSSALWERSFSGIEGNVKPLEALYFMNQFFVLFPAGVFWFGVGLWKNVYKRKTNWFFLACWFTLFFIVFSIMRTKLAVYLLPMLVPASLFAANEIWRGINQEISTKTFALLTGGTLFALLWASSQTWRNEVKDFLLLRADSGTLLSLGIFAVLFLIILVISYFLISNYVFTNFLRKRVMHLFLIPSLAVSLYHSTYKDNTEYLDGGTELAEFVRAEAIERLVVAGYERNPQLTYYLAGADIGWRDDIQFKRIIPPQDSSQFTSWLLEETLNEPPTTLLVLEKDKFIRYNMINPMLIVPPDYELVLSTRRYACFQRIKKTYLALGEHK